MGASKAGGDTKKNMHKISKIKKKGVIVATSIPDVCTVHMSKFLKYFVGVSEREVKICASPFRRQ